MASNQREDGGYCDPQENNRQLLCVWLSAGGMVDGGVDLVRIIPRGHREE